MAILTEEELKEELEAFKKTCDTPVPKGMNNYYDTLRKADIEFDSITMAALVSWLNRAELQKEKENAKL